MYPVKELRKIRHELHHQPEVSAKEIKTSQKIYNFLKKLKADNLITDLCGHGIAAIFDFKKPGPTLVFRAELDALPIPEKNTVSYRSITRGVSHACGHDGHMTILLGVAARLKQLRSVLQGKIVLLFQPSEEIAYGAKCIVNHSFYQQLQPDYIYALHNIPGFPRGNIILKKGIFASASKGMILELTGATAHAGHPEQGNSPVFGMIEIIQQLEAIQKAFQQQGKHSIITIIHIKVGKIAFGTTPGKAVMMATFRAYDDSVLSSMSQQALTAIQNSVKNHHLQHHIKWVEIFPATYNNTQAITYLQQAIQSLNLPQEHITTPFSWSEDFSYYLQHTPGALFGLGTGIDHASLHSETYDFPDDLIIDGINIIIQLIQEIITTSAGE